MELRNCILIALAFDATAAEVEQARSIMDRVYGGPTATVDPKFVVTGTVAADGTTAATTNQPIQPANNDTASTAQFDNTGLPWDERIHSSSRALTDKGVWKSKRGVDPAYKKQIEAQLLATVGNGNTLTSGSVADGDKGDIVVTGSGGIWNIVADPTPPPLAAPAGLPSLPGANAAPPVDPAYTGLVKLIAENTNSAANPTGRLTDDWVKQVLTHFGVAEGSLQNLAHAPQLVPQIDSYIRTALGL
jgi:hypothetical protein